MRSTPMALDPLPGCLARFHAHVAARPDQAALIVADRTFTYATLAADIALVAAALRERGVGPEVVVGLAVGRADYPIGLMAILEAGGTYLPLDPALPAARRDLLARSAGAALVLDTLPSPTGPDPLGAPRSAWPSPDQRAYIMYTSGTSGPPKGVEIEHGALAERYVRSPYHDLLAPGDVLAAVTAVSWNPSVFEVLYTLASGATIALADATTLRDPRLLAPFLEAHGVTFMRAVPSLWQALLDSGWRGKFDLKAICHGERLNPKLEARLAACTAMVSNTYGSTEASVFRLDDPHVHVFDADLAPTPIDEVGEIYIRGPVLARGYLGDAALTASRFVVAHDRRYYRTGDIARVHADHLELLGRRDAQVKIRGQRVELGEVEHAIARHPAVHEVVASADDGRLVVHLVADTTTEALRADLATQLAEHLIPSVFVFMPALPRTAHGKVDRRALPAVPSARPALATAYRAPTTPTEAALVALFRECLGLDEVGIDDDFLALGGDSLRAAQIAARLDRSHALELPLVAFFRTPTVRRLAAIIDARATPALTPITIAPSHVSQPLSFAQERLWFLHQLAPESCAYSLPSALAIAGPLDCAALAEALRTIVRRHGALRTSFALEANTPTQTVHAVDLTLDHVVTADPTATIAAAARQPFHLTQAPLIRATLFERGPDDHVLFVNMHHIASDGWSNALFRRELGLAYNAALRGESTHSPRLPIQYVDFAQWQRHHLSSLEPQLAYWRTQLAELEPLPLPTDHPRPPVFTHRGARVIAILPPRLQHALKALARAHDASLYMLTLAAFKALLHRYTGATDVAVGSPLAGRNRPETQDLIGFFVNALVMRSRVDPAASFTTLLDQVKATTLAAFEHQDLPFERLVADLNPTRDLTRHPLIQTMFALQTTPIDVVPLDGLTTTPTYFDAETTRFDCELHLWERADGLHCHLIYNVDLFDAWRMRQWLVHFEVLLEAICADPTVPIATIDLMTAHERATLAAWNASDAPYPEATLHALFADQAARTPEACAIGAFGAQPALTYRALDARSDALAAHLQSLDLGPRPIVAITLGRSPDYIIAALAILKLGGAYLPIDPAYPTARRQAMLDDAGARCVLSALPPFVPTRFDPPPTGPDDRAYVIYTSGSTGRPNGVEVTHRGVVNLAAWHTRTFAVTPTDRATFNASPAFDAAAWELWPHLLAGASIHIPDDETRVTPAKLVAWLRAQRIDLAFLSTPLLEACAHESFIGMPLRALLTGGDRLRTNPGLPVPIYNGYGPTECTVVATAGRVQGTHLPDIGRPLANVRVYVLDAFANEVPIGIAGDLYIGGVGLARGYLGNPALSAERFLDTPRGRLYRSGDRARWRPDGTLDFLGRRDDQVKLRGIRIELGEIDATLVDHPDVHEAITVVHDERLVSYVVARPSRALEAAYVAQWQALYEAEYAAPGASPDLDTSGWMSSFTGQPIPDADMREWAEVTVAEIERHAPKRVLEIGTGTGMLLHRLARSAHYVGSDFSRATIQRLQRRHPDLRLVAKPAHDLTWLGDETFDTVVLNSIVQYFPSADYLADVITNAIAHVTPGGRVFVGDVRNWDTLEAFHRKVARDRGTPDERVAEAMLDDKELVVSPGFFEALRAREPRITTIEIRPKRGRAHTEMALFRYDVTLHLDLAPHTSDAQVFALDAPASAFADDVLLTGLVDARHDPHGRDLEALHTLAARLGKRLDLRLGAGSRTIDALFTSQPDPIVHPAFATHTVARTTDPLRRMRAADILPSLREHLARKLPEAYLPAAIVFLDALPLTPNGKIDRRRLPPPRTTYTPPPTTLPPTQRALVRIFSDALAVPCAPGDNFFALGGHSLLAVQVLARIGDELGVDLPLAALFERPTITALAERIDRVRTQPLATAFDIQSAPPPHAPEPTRIELTPMDVNFHYGRTFLKGPPRAWYQVLELALPSLDVPRLDAAIIATMNRHPIMRARLSDANALGPDVHWAVGPHVTRAPLDVHDLTSDAAFAAFTNDLVARSYPLDEAPLFRFVLARRAHGDHLFVRYNHGAVDASGLGAAIDTLFAHYLRRPDPTTRSLPYRTHELLARHEHHTTLATTNELAHYRAALRGDPRIDARWWRPRSLHPTPIAPDGGDPTSSDCHRVELELSAELSARLAADATRLRTSLDRLLLVGLLAGAARWNHDHQRPGRVEAYWAVNLRPPRDFQSIVANLFAWSRVRSPPPAEWQTWRSEVLDGGNDFLVRGALDWITFVEAFHQRRMPRALRWLIMSGIKHSAPSIVISNTLPYGQVGEGPLAHAMGVTHSELHSRYGFTDRPILILGQRDSRLYLRVIYPRRLFDEAAAQRFLATLRDAIAASG